MTEKECLDRVRTGNFNGGYGFDMQLLVDTVGHIGEMMRKGRLILLEPLCKFLAGYAAPPVRSPLATYGSLEEAWKAYLEKWAVEQKE